MATRNTTVVRQWVDEAWNHGKLEVAKQVFAPNCVEYGITDGLAEITGIEAQKSKIRALRTAFPDLHLTIEDTISEGEKVMVRWIAGGTHKGEWMGLAPTGKYVTWGGVSVFRFVDGKIQELWRAEDIFGQWQQLGAIGLYRQAHGPR